jgi:hypothetical protein
MRALPRSKLVCPPKTCKSQCGSLEGCLSAASGHWGDQRLPPSRSSGGRVALGFQASPLDLDRTIQPEHEPTALSRGGRGGRRRAGLSWGKEERFLRKRQQAALP